MNPNPSYHFHAGGMATRLEGQQNVKALHRTWADTNQSIFYAENEVCAVADNYVASVSIFHQQVWGKALGLNKALGHLPGGLSGSCPMNGKCASKPTCVELRRRCYAKSERQQIMW